MRLTDSEGNLIGYLPVTLKAGETSAVIVLKAIPTGAGERLRSQSSAAAQVLGRIAGVGVFQDLSVAPIGLGAYVGGFALIEIKIVASAGVVGLQRVGQYIGVASGTAAGWLA